MLEVDHQSRSNPDLQSVDYLSKDQDKGGAFGAKLGIILRPNDQLRIGFAVHTPKTYKINKEYSYSLTSNFEDGANSQSVVTAYTEEPNIFKYQVTTPARFVSAVGFVINKLALLNAEVELYDYTSARMFSDLYSFTAENNNMRNLYKNVVIFRIGGELNFPDAERKDVAYRLRFGFANSPSPYSSKTAGNDQILRKANNQVSTGFGYRDKDYYLDFALSYGFSSSYYTPYVTGNSGFEAASISNKRNNLGFTFTLGANFD
jgi:long-subunit fatty acid transport protein